MKAAMQSAMKEEPRRLTLAEIHAALHKHEQGCRRCAKHIGCMIGRRLETAPAGITLAELAS